MATQTYSGSCHCGAVQFECEIDLRQATSRCNCSICTKGRFWKAIADGSAFRLLQGADALVDYQFGSKAIHHLFCRTCGIKPFGRGHVGGIGEFYAVNLACLDDASPETLANASVIYEDGRSNRWDRTPEEPRFL